MSVPLDDGGPAFPCQELNGQGDPIMAMQFGLSIRDWFAGQALGHIPELLAVAEENASCWNIAKHAYQIADAMMTARKEVQS